jgi:hypothetical protein
MLGNHDIENADSFIAAGRIVKGALSGDVVEPLLTAAC